MCRLYFLVRNQLLEIKVLNSFLKNAKKKLFQTYVMEHFSIKLKLPFHISPMGSSRGMDPDSPGIRSLWYRISAG